MSTITGRRYDPTGARAMQTRVAGTGDWRSRVAQLVAKHYGTKSRDAERPTSYRTQKTAYACVMAIFEWLRKDLGFKQLANPHALDHRHFVALADHLRGKADAGEFGPAHTASFATYCRHLARWIGKPELVAIFSKRLGKEVCKRQLIAVHDKSWTAKGLNPDEIILAVAAYERWMGLVLLAQRAFGLRKMEALMLQPLRDILPAALTNTDRGASKRGKRQNDELEKDWQLVNVFIRDGAKGGRYRVIPVDDPLGLQVARLLRQDINYRGDRERLPPPGRTLAQNQRFYTDTMERFGLTKAQLGVTGHGLRAGYACDQLQAKGITATVRGGNGQHPDPLHQQVAYKEVTEAMGHGRISVVGAYAGCITPQAHARQKKAAERAALREAINAQTVEPIHQFPATSEGVSA